MKTKEIIFIVEDSLDGGYEARAIGESIFTEGDSIDELKKNITEAVSCHFENNNLPLVSLQFLKNN
jgi:predicted RNase H-like HicB family nuclease